jgi:hypothetical protein
MRLGRLKKDAVKAWDPILEDWGEYGTEKRHIAEQGYLYQLEHDPLYAQGIPAKKGSMWSRIHIYLESGGS